VILRCGDVRDERHLPRGDPLAHLGKQVVLWVQQIVRVEKQEAVLHLPRLRDEVEFGPGRLEAAHVKDAAPVVEGVERDLRELLHRASVRIASALTANADALPRVAGVLADAIEEFVLGLRPFGRVHGVVSLVGLGVARTTTGALRAAQNALRMGTHGEDSASTEA
jgi:hypothetical protein